MATAPGDPTSEFHALLTVEEAAKVLRIGRSKAYAMAREYTATGGAAGMPVISFGPGCLRVPLWALEVLVTTGRVVCLSEVPTGTRSTASRPTGENVAAPGIASSRAARRRAARPTGDGQFPLTLTFER